MEATKNGSQRHSLNDSIYRLNRILDGLEVGIPEAVRDALQQSVGVAVAEGIRAALVEVLTSGGLADLLARKPQPEVQEPVHSEQEKPGWRARLLGGVGAAVSLAGLLARRASERATALGMGARHLVSRLSPAWELRTPILLTLVAAGLASVVTLASPAWVGVALSGLGGATCAAAVQVGLWLRRVLCPPLLEG